MEYSDTKRRNNYLLQRLSNDLHIDIAIEDLLERYASIFTSYEEDRERLRIIAVKKDKNSADSEDKKNKSKRETLALIGKRVLKKIAIDMETAKLKAELFCKLWQQVKNVNLVQEQEELIQNNISKLEERTGESFL